MNEDARSVSRMLAHYRDLIRGFSIGELAPNTFQAEYLTRFKNDPDQVIGREFDVLDELFADADDYVEDPTLRAETGGIDGDELRQRARHVYARLFDGRHARHEQ